ncbi:MAG: hypothetical protein HYS81_04885 [Candidatus Aenigmatarchaeota archaeon]|nr:MAG: hypothetical protein HYS81_04885 [Candidatus Aenigmarchaeota archaeon]
MGARERFLKAYANIPLNFRSEAVAMLDGEPVSWQVAYIEISNNTPKGKKILKILEELKII